MQKDRAILSIVKTPDKILQKKATCIPPADIATPRIQRLIADMKATLAETPDGVGLAAPQVGKSIALFIVSDEAKEIDKAERAGWERRRTEGLGELTEKPYEIRAWNYFVFINPVARNTSRKKLDGPEGCLSVPGRFGTVTRHEKITVDAYDEHGKKFTRGATRFFARVIQHELDHLEGTLFIDAAKNLIAMPPEKKSGDEK